MEIINRNEATKAKLLENKQKSCKNKAVKQMSSLMTTAFIDFSGRTRCHYHHRCDTLLGWMSEAAIHTV